MARTRLSEADAEVVLTRVQVAERHRDRTVRTEYQTAWSRYFGSDYSRENAATASTTRSGHATGRNVDTANRPMRINYDFALVEQKVKSIGFHYPDLLVLPLTDEAQPFSDAAQTALKHYWSEDGCHVQPEVQACLFDRIVMGMGIAYVGWEFIQEISGIVEVHMEGDRVPQEGDPAAPGEIPPSAPQEDVAQGQPEQAERQIVLKTVKDQPLVRRVNPLNFFVDPECRNDLNRASYCGYEEWRPLNEVRKDPRYKNVRDVKGSTETLSPFLDEAASSTDNAQQPSDIKRVRLVHYFEKGEKRHIVMAPDEHRKPLLVEQWWWEYPGYPFTVLAGVRSPDDFWATPDSTFYATPVREIEQARALQGQYLRTSTPKLTLTGSPATPQQRKQCQSMVPYTVIELAPGQNMAAIPLPQNQMEIASVVADARSDLQFIAGVSQYELASSPSKRLAGAAEVQAIQSGPGPRLLWDRQSFENFCSRILKKMLQLLQQYSTVPKRLPVYDDYGQAVVGWHTFDASQIRGEFQISVHVGSTSAPNASDVLQSIGFLIQSLPGFIQLLPAALQIGIDLRPVLIAAIRAIPGIRHVDQIISPLLGNMQGGQAPGMAAPGMQPAQPQMGMLPGAQQAAPPGPVAPPGSMPGFGAPPPPVAPQGGAEGNALLTPEFLQALLMNGR